MTFSEKLAKAMRDRNISIRELSERTGIPKSAIQRYTSGETERIPIDRMKMMADALGIDPAYVMGWLDVSDVLHGSLDHVLGSESPTAKKLRELSDKMGLHTTSDTEAELLDIFRGLNAAGQDILMGTARGLATNPDMKKGGTSSTETA